MIVVFVFVFVFAFAFALIDFDFVRIIFLFFTSQFFLFFSCESNFLSPLFNGVSHFERFIHSFIHSLQISPADTGYGSAQSQLYQIMLKSRPRIFRKGKKLHSSIQKQSHYPAQYLQGTVRQAYHSMLMCILNKFSQE
jgi:hypothetical protein